MTVGGDAPRCCWGVLLNYLIPESVFLLIASIATFATVWVWLMILFPQVAMRRSMSAEQVAQLKFPVPFWPCAPIAAIAFMLFVLRRYRLLPGRPGGPDRRRGVDRAAGAWPTVTWVKPAAGQAAPVTPDPTFSHR